MSKIYYIKNEAKMFNEIRVYAQECYPKSKIDIYMKVQPDFLHYYEGDKFYAVDYEIFVDEVVGDHRDNIIQLAFDSNKKTVGYFTKCDIPVADKFSEIVESNLAYRIGEDYEKLIPNGTRRGSTPVWEQDKTK